ncbi:hypothetical protein E1166_01390 [Micromonospora sp. KC213]|nr:hypothetical protein E1166_01390 [Micromonospora sp. KC213]
MPSTFGQWLIVILALLLGGAAGWLARDRQLAGGTARTQPIVEGDPVVGLTEAEKAHATATIATPRPEATVDYAPAPAVIDEPTDRSAAPSPVDEQVPQFTAPAEEAIRADATDEGPSHDTAPVAKAPISETPVSETPVPQEPIAETPVSETLVTETPVSEEPVSETPVPAEATRRLDHAAPVDAETTSPVSVEAEEPATASPGVPAPRTPIEDSEPTVEVDALDRATSDDAGSVAEPATTAPATVSAPAGVVPPATDEPAPADEAALTNQTAPADEAAPVGEPVPADQAAPAPGDEAAPTDDFRRIQGVGPKMAAALQAAGIRTYRQLAELDETALRETIRAAGLRTAPSLATWPQQAKVLAGTDAESVLPAPAGAGEQN